MGNKTKKLLENATNELMIDLETLGRFSGAPVVGIAAVQFNLDSGKLGEEFYERIDITSALEYGKPDGNTLKWWLQQEEAARKGIYEDGRDTISVLEELYDFISGIGEDVQVWGNSQRFDIGILVDAFINAGWNSLPWAYYNENDVRTIVRFNPEIKFNTKFKGTKHNPLDDCKHQIKYIVKIWNTAKKGDNLDVRKNKDHGDDTLVDRYGKTITVGSPFYYQKGDKEFKLKRTKEGVEWNDKKLSLDEARKKLPKKDLYLNPNKPETNK